MFPSVIIHILLVFIIVKAFNGVTVFDKIINGSRMIVFLVIPYVILTNLCNIRERLPL